MAGFEASRVVAASQQRSYDVTIKAPLPEIFGRGFGPLPRVVSADQDGEWGAAGRSRTVRVADGSEFIEDQLEADEPRSCRYRLSRFRGRQALLVREVDGRWTFEDVDGGTRIGWSWQVQPASPVARALMPVVAALWRGYAGRALATIDVTATTR